MKKLLVQQYKEQNKDTSEHKVLLCQRDSCQKSSRDKCVDSREEIRAFEYKCGQESSVRDSSDSPKDNSLHSHVQTSASPKTPTKDHVEQQCDISQGCEDCRQNRSLEKDIRACRNCEELYLKCFGRDFYAITPCSSKGEEKVMQSHGIVFGSDCANLLPGKPKELFKKVLSLSLLLARSLEHCSQNNPCVCPWMPPLVGRPSGPGTPHPPCCICWVPRVSSMKYSSCSCPWSCDGGNQIDGAARQERTGIHVLHQHAV